MLELFNIFATFFLVVSVVIYATFVCAYFPLLSKVCWFFKRWRINLKFRKSDREGKNVWGKLQWTWHNLEKEIFLTFAIWIFHLEGIQIWNPTKWALNYARNSSLKELKSCRKWALRLQFSALNKSFIHFI